jgi:hypothetical protein
VQDKKEKAKPQRHSNSKHKNQNRGPIHCRKKPASNKNTNTADQTCAAQRIKPLNPEIIST